LSDAGRSGLYIACNINWTFEKVLCT